MSTTFFNNCGVSIATLALGLSLAATPVTAQGVGGSHGGGGGGLRVGGGGFHGGGGGFHGGGGRFQGGSGGWRGGGGNAWNGGGGRWNGGYGGYSGWGGGYGQDYGYAAGALGLGLLGGAIIGSQVPYYGSGYAYPDDGGVVSSGSCASRFKSYNPATGTYLGYDGQRHPCP